MSVAAPVPADAKAGAVSAQAHPPDAGHAGRYLAALAGGVVAMLALFYTVLLALQGNGSLPPPAFANSLCVDEKLRFLREHRPASPDLLIVGSSVAWRHVDSAALGRATGYATPLNAGFCGLHVNQSVFAADLLLERLPSIKHVVMVASPQDFADCRNKPTAAFDRSAVDRYVFGGASPWPYYMTYFSPTSLWRNARDLKDKKANRIELDPLVFTAAGDGPLDTSTSRDTLLYGAPQPLDAACFSALGSLAQRLQREGRPFTVVTTPLHPAWRAAHDADGKFLHALDAGIVQALGPGRNGVWNAAREWTPDPGAFTDAIHLRWSAVPPFTQALAERVRVNSIRAAP